MENEVTVQDNMKGLVQKNQFNRVDFENPTTILNYGQEILDKMEKIISNATKNIEKDSLVDVDFKQRVNKLSGFSEKLDDVEEKRIKQDKGLSKIYNKFLKLINNSDKNTHLSYNEEYMQYVNNVDQLVEDVKKMYEEAKDDFDLFNTFITQIKPFIAILQEVYDFGILDRSSFETEVLNLEKNFEENQENSDLKREAIIKRQILDIFDEKLYSLEKSKLAINEVVIQWNMRQINAIKLLTSYQSFLSIDKSVLKLNGTALVGAKKQKEEAENLKYLIDGMNKAMVESSKEANYVINSVNALTKDGNTKLETILTVDKYLQEGVELLKQGAKEKKAFIKASSEQLAIISEHFNNFNLEVKESLMLEALQGTNSSTSDKVKIKTKN